MHVSILVMLRPMGNYTTSVIEDRPFVQSVGPPPLVLTRLRPSLNARALALRQLLDCIEQDLHGGRFSLVLYALRQDGRLGLEQVSPRPA